MTRGYRDPPLRFAPGLAARAALALGLVLAAAPAAAESWQLFATATAAKVFFDRDSVRAEDGYLRYRVRIEYNESRTSNDGKVRFRSSVTEQVGQCREPKVAAASVALYDAGGALVSDIGRSPGQWKQAMTSVGAEGLQARLLQHACRLAGREEPPKSGAASASVVIGAGTVVAGDGLVITNHHVTQGCESLTVMDVGRKRADAMVRGADIANDLALLKVEQQFTDVASFRRDRPLQAGESVTVVGFPLASVLGFEPNVAFGYVSATGGLRGDSTRFQISAPIHKGNSGGPILDQSGQVVGIVTSKLNALEVQKRTGDLPQNISFGVRSEVAQTFLERHSVSAQGSAGGAKLDNVEVARIGRSITVLVACRRTAPAAASAAVNK